MDEKNKETVFLKKWFLLLLGAALIIAAGMRWNIAIAGWLFPIPFLMYMRLGYSRAQLLVVLTVAFFLQVSKIVSEPFYIFIAVVAGIQSGIFFWLILYMTEKSRKAFEKNEGLVTLVFASLVALFEFIGARFSPLGTWGMAVNTQLDNLPFLQIASLTGPFAASFLMMWTAATLESLLYFYISGRSQKAPSIKWIYSLLAVFLAVYAYGGIRLDNQAPGRHVEVASVSAKTYGIMDVLQNEELRGRNNEEVFTLITKAARKKAKIVVTNEGALVLLPETEKQGLLRLQELSRNNRIAIAAGYVIYRGKEEKFLNKMVMIDSNGNILQEYHKQFIPPGEPAEYIASDIASAEIGGIQLGGAICYDFDSMQISAAHGKNETGLVVLPSSDWRGIDPIHTQMVRLRAIEQGYGIVRSSRASASAAYDAYGRTRAWMPWHETNDGIMIASLPAEPVFTIYKYLGDWFVAGIFVFLAWAFYLVYKRRRKS